MFKLASIMLVSLCFMNSLEARQTLQGTAIEEGHVFERGMKPPRGRGPRIIPRTKRY